MKTKRVQWGGLGQSAGLLFSKSAYFKVFLITLFIICFYSGLLSVTNIRVGNNEQFTDMQTAINHALTGLGDETEAQIEVIYNSLQTTSGYTINIGSSNLVKLTLIGRGAGSSTAISVNAPRAFFVTGNSYDNKEIAVNQFNITGQGTLVSMNGIEIMGGLHALQVQSCGFSAVRYGIYVHPSFVNNTIRNFELDSCIFHESTGTGCGQDFKPFYLNYNGITPGVTSAYVITNNVISGYADALGEIVTGSYSMYNAVDSLLVTIDNNSFVLESANAIEPRFLLLSMSIGNLYQVNVTNNMIINGCIDIQGLSGTVENNTFYSQSERNLIQQLSISSGGINNGFGVSIKNNTFSGTANKAISHIYRSSFGTMAATIINNALLNSGIALAITTSQGYLNGNVAVPLLYNNLIACGGEPFSCNLTFNTPIEVSYSFFLSTFPNNVSFSIDTGTCLAGDPLISMDEENHTYTPIWNNDHRSPLIMAGFGGTGWGSQSHSDRADIGSVQFDAFPHEYVTYTFPAGNERNGLKWMSFPTLDRIWNPTTGDPDMALAFFNPLLNPLKLNSITWKVLDNPEENIRFEELEWVGNLSHHVIPQQGYKIQMAQGLQNQETIAVPGNIPMVNQYPLTIKAQPAGKAAELGNENWLGYFHPGTVNARDAFAGVMDNLWFIQTQDWTMARETMIPGSPWIVALQYGKEPVLNYGDMAVVKCFSDDQFYWCTDANNQTPREKELPSHYVYEEKADYVPFYVELDGSDLPSELAIFVDDVCKGAAVVCDSLVEIPGYVVDNPDPNAIVEIRAYYEDKAAVDYFPAFQVWNQTNRAYEHKPLILSRKNYYYKLKLVKGNDENPIAPDISLDIYPNPFNPSVSIGFSLPEEAEISLDIYNQKGQLVRNLARGRASAGKHCAVWDGTDNRNQRIASGVYYTRLTWQNKSSVKKMVMLK